jgi:hypothetical protein
MPSRGDSITQIHKKGEKAMKTKTKVKAGIAVWGT